MTPYDEHPAVAAERLSWWRRLVVHVLLRRPRWATAYTRRQLRLADEELHCSEHLLQQTEQAADAADRAPTVRLTELHRSMRRELYASVRAAERRLARSGAYELGARGVIQDAAIARAVAYVASEVRPALDEIAADIVAGLGTDRAGAAPGTAPA